MLLCNNTPRAVQAYTWGEAANYEIGYGVKGCRYEHNQQHPRNKPSRKRCLTFLVASSFLTSANAGYKNDNKSNRECNPFHLTTSTISDGCKANKFGRMQLSDFGLNRACGRTCTVEKNVVARYKGQRFHAASKVLVDARELAKAKRYELKQNAEFNWS